MQVNPKGKEKGVFRVLRGDAEFLGYHDTLPCCPSIRERSVPTPHVSGGLGFRIIMGVKSNAS